MDARSLFLISAAGFIAAQQTNPFIVTTNAQGAFSITLPQWEGFALTSANDIGFQSGGKWLSSGSGLTASAYSSFGGSDSWGDYNATSLTWLDAGGKPALVTTISVYSNTPAIVFGTSRVLIARPCGNVQINAHPPPPPDQYFPAAVSTGGSVATKDAVVSAFPSFALPANASGSNVGVMQWLGPFIDNGSRQPVFGTFAGASYSSGVQGGPLLLFDSSGAQAAVFSSLSQFMAGSVVKEAAAGSLRAGVMGSVGELPAGARGAALPRRGRLLGPVRGQPPPPPPPLLLLLRCSCLRLLVQVRALLRGGPQRGDDGLGRRAPAALRQGARRRARRLHEHAPHLQHGPRRLLL